MNPINLLTVRKQSPYKMDKNSNRYRVCPNDGVDFMAEHRNRKFCHNKVCTNEYHNLKKKTKSLIPINNRIHLDLKLPIKDENISIVMSEVKAETTNEVKNEPVLEIKEEGIDKLQHNLNILDSLEIDSVNGTIFSVEQIFNLKYDFSVYDGRGPMYNTGAENCFFLVIRNYRIYRLEFSRLLVVKII
jgi:ribosomal protein S27AE